MKIIIPARGGSKRIPNKNLIDLNGKPLISYAIEECLSVTDEVYVSTDCSSISKVSSDYGAKIIERPKELATDTCRTETTIEHFLKSVPTEEFACVQATTPTIKGDYIKRGFELLKKFDSVISVVERAEYLWSNNATPINFERDFRKRTQDMNKIYSENGSFYITTKKQFLKQNCLYDGEVGFVIMPQIMSLEIDSIEDLELVRIIMKNLIDKDM
jgi:CMP-N,N'-diacetyllegionaminic acid synthase